MNRAWTCLLAAGLAGCHGSRGAGAASLAVYGLGWSLVSRAEGGCFAVCEGVNQVCNPETGFCEPDPCGAGCGDGQHCDIWGPVPRCVDDSMPTDLVQPPLAAPTLPVSTPAP